MRIEFHGVRGSTPCSGDQYSRYGGNSSCVALTAEGHAPVIFDLGTGLRPYGERLGCQTPFHGSVLLTHLHWDHVQGLPFFIPLHQAGSSLDIYGPRQDEGPTRFRFCFSQLPVIARRVLTGNSQKQSWRRPAIYCWLYVSNWQILDRIGAIGN